jgi:toxin ParE1/3/4
MDCRVVWAETAWHDLEQVVTHIARDAFHYAAAFAREPRDAARSLASYALRGHVVPEFNDPHIREVFVPSYRMIYSATGGAVHILAFIHGAHDLDALWERENRPKS